TLFTTSATATTINGMDNPVGLAYDSVHDRLFVADQNNLRVLVFDTIAISDGEDAVNVLGEPNFITINTGNTVSATRIGPVNQLAYDSTNDRLFVTDFIGSSGGAATRVLVFNTSTISDGEPAEDVIGAADFTTTGQDLTGTSLKRFAYPTGLAYDDLH